MTIDSVTTTETSSQTAPASQTSVNSPAALSGEVANEPSSISFEGIGQDFDEGAMESELAVPAVAPPAVPPVAKVAPVVPPVQTQPATPPAPAQPVAAQPAAQPVQPVAQPQETEAQPVTVDGVLEKLQNDAGNILQQIAPAFALSPEQITELETNAVEAVPKLLAQTYQRAITTNLEYMKMLVPQMIQRHFAQESASKDAETAFFSAYPDLNVKDHGKDIITFINAFTQANPGITRDQLISLVGPAVMMKNGITAKGGGVRPQAAATVRQPAFSPAVNSAPIVAQTQIDNTNPFAGLGIDFNE